MPFYLSTQTLKKEAKILTKHWNHSQIKTTEARDLLCQLYGYKNNHHYQKLQKEQGVQLNAITQETVTLYYKSWIQKLALLANINETQAQRLLHFLWHDYVVKNTEISTKLYQAEFQFFGTCLDFVALEKLLYAFNDNPSVKDAIEAMGIPHVEVGCIVVNGLSKAFEYALKEGDKVEVYAHGLLERSSAEALPYKAKKISFLLDVHLGALARYLRMAGFDTLYDSKDYGDAFLAEVASNEAHIMLSRDIGLLKRAKLKYGRWVRNTNPQEQFKEIVEFYGLKKEFKPMSRCLKCNESISLVDKSSVENLVPPKVYQWKEQFFQCSGCQQVYWEGSHYESMMALLGEV